MKRIAVILACVIYALCACSRVESTGVEDTVQLRFDPVLLAVSKADIPGEYPADVPFGAQVWDYRIGKDASSGDVFLDDARITQNNGEWGPVPGILWPGVERELAVLAYSPFGKAAAVNMTEGVQFESVNTSVDQTDLLYTELRQGLHRNDGGVINLPFRHALCHVDFAMRTNASSDERVEIRSLSLSAIATEGSFHSLPEPVWTLTGSAPPVAFFTGLKLIRATNTELPGSGAWVIPQTVSAIVRAELDYTDPSGHIYTFTLESEPFVKIFEPGRQYTLILSFLPETETLELDDTHRQNP